MTHIAFCNLRAALRRSFLLMLLAGALAFVPALFDMNTRAQSGKLAPTNTGAFSGTITDATTSAPLADVTVIIFNSDGFFVASANTNAAGNYISPLLSEGTYYASTANSLDYMDELYDNIACEDGCTITSGTPISVTAGATTSGINFALAQGGHISGRVTDSETGEPLENISINIFSTSMPFSLSATTDSSGNYVLEELLPPGTYYAATSTFEIYLNEAYDNIPCRFCDPRRDGTPITVSPGATTSGIDFALDKGGVVTGSVTNAATGAPIFNASVEVYSSDGIFIFIGTTNAAGEYKTTEGLPTGTYYAVTNTTGFINKLYNGFTCAPCDPTTGTPFSVTAGKVTSGINFSLAAGGRISGSIRNAATSAPLSGVRVRIYNSVGELVTTPTSSLTGNYTSSAVLPTGTYYARTISPNFITQAYNGIDCIACTPAIGVPITVTAGSTSTGVNFALTAGGRISGTVTDAATSAPVSNVPVQFFSSNGGLIGTAFTDFSGSYTSSVGLATGSYYVRASFFGNYVDQVYSNIDCAACDVTTGVPVSVTAGATTSGINFAFRTGGKISGTVTDAATSAPIANVQVEILNSSGDQITLAGADNSGNYISSPALPSGTYYARTVNTPGYVEELYNNIPCVGCAATSGTPITVTAGSTTTGINFTLEAGGRISGSVTDSATTLPVGGVTVEIYNLSGILVTSVLTNATGNYTTRANLPTGTYYARAANNVGYVTKLYNNVTCLACDVTTGTPVSVTAGATTSGINFALDTGGRFVGAVNDISDLTPIPEAGVEIYNSSGTLVGSTVSGFLGNYTSPALPAGTYFARTTNSRGFANKLYNNIPCTGCVVTTGDPITVSVGAVTSGINFALCSYALSPKTTLFSSLGGEGSVSVTASGTCVWTATSNDAWIEITSEASGTGNGAFNFIVRENTTSSSRTGTITVGSSTFTINQSGGATACAVTISPSFALFSAAGGAGTINVTTQAGCAWKSESNKSWITITTSCCGIGNGSVGYTIAPNLTGSGRSGVITINGQKFNVKQK
jgi:hypothetical protein